MTATSILGPLAAFALILALIPIALWLLRRSPLGRLSGGAPGGPLRVVATLALGPHQRIVTVEVGAGEDRRWLVLGVSPAGIHTLHTLPPQPEAPAGTPTALPIFAQLLARHAPGHRAGAGSPDVR